MSIFRTKILLCSFSNVMFAFYCSSVLLSILIVGTNGQIEDDVEMLTFLPQSTVPVNTPRPPDEKITEISEVIIANRQQRLVKTHSPYLVREDLIIESTGELVIDPGEIGRAHV